MSGWMCSLGLPHRLRVSSSDAVRPCVETLSHVHALQGCCALTSAARASRIPPSDNSTTDRRTMPIWSSRPIASSLVRHSSTESPALPAGTHESPKVDLTATGSMTKVGRVAPRTAPAGGGVLRKFENSTACLGQCHFLVHYKQDSFCLCASSASILFGVGVVSLSD